MADTRADTLAKLGDLAASAGLRRIHMLAWRDLADVEAGGSELHATTVARLWAEAGIEVTIRTSYAQGHPPESNRDGYRVIRKAGRYLVFPRAIFSEATGRHGAARRARRDLERHAVLVAAVGDRAARDVFLHHVHGAMWKMVLPPNLAAFGETVEKRIAPPIYRRSRIVTLSQSSRDELIDDLKLKPVARVGRAARHRPALHARAATARRAPARRRGRPADAGQAVRRADQGDGRGARHASRRRAHDRRRRRRARAPRGR